MKSARWWNNRRRRARDCSCRRPRQRFRRTLPL